ncbi:SKP1-interacting partner 15 [Diospyros lotus]|uniref:SKP1-interacting partner 15 n=1 Tax=Diospyros lotus TaxID=55363 RepID=UPI00224F60F8|nr:SKP1-interacting partner 15 [Diospyros lotus]
MDVPPIFHLPQDTLHQIFFNLPLRQIIRCRAVCKFFNQTLSTPSFLHVISTQTPPLCLIALRPPHYHRHHRHHHVSPDPTVHAFDPDQNLWLRFPLTFLPFTSPQPVASSLGLVYLWAESANSIKTLVACNPLTRQYRILPQLGSAWSSHGSVLVGPPNRVLVLCELATFYFSGHTNNWVNFSSNLPSKPRSPILVADSVLALCDVGSPWRSQWKLFSCTISTLRTSQKWARLEKHEWGEVFDILKRPRLVRGNGNKVLMVGGLRSSFSLNASCSTILILRLDLGTMEWDEAGQMPPEMFRCFQESSKFKVFGGGNRVCFSAKRLGRLALWNYSDEAGKGLWRWIDDVPGCGDGLCRGYVFEARLSALP